MGIREIKITRGKNSVEWIEKGWLLETDDNETLNQIEKILEKLK